MHLNRLTLRNFKGCRFFELIINGQDCSVFGDNGTYKTTLYDSFLYLMFGKDSQNKSDFEIKTLSPAGEPLHNLEHEVEAELEDNGKILTLRKVFTEKYTKKRGSAKSEFTGHNTEHFIDGVPATKGDYTAKINSIVQEDIFKLLTNPDYFNNDDAMKTKNNPGWKVRRNILLEIAGDLTDEEVIAGDKKLAGLPAILNGRALDDYKKIIAARKATINKELEKIPVRINEAQRGLPDITGLRFSQLLNDIPNLKTAIKEQEQKLVQVQSGGEVAEKRTKLREIESELLDIKNKHREKQDKLIDSKRQELSVAKTQNVNIQGEVNTIARNIQSKQTEIDAINKTLNNLRDQWQTVNKSEFTFEQADTCPTCNRPLPEEELQEARDKALAAFNLDKAERITIINADGKRGKEHLIELNSEIMQLQIDFGEASKNLAVSAGQAAKLQSEITNMTAGVNPEATPEYAAKLKEKQSVEQDIAKLQEGTFTDRYTIQTEIDRLGTALLAMENNLKDIERHEQGQARIRELESQERDLAAEYEKLEGELFLCEQFVVAKVGMLEEKINSRFKLAKFKLFETQINEGIKECCETTVNGVPYSGGLNNAARINVGLDIINTLSEHYGFRAPVFCDNAEAVTRLIPMNAQVIRLVVSEPDKVLRVEVK